MRRAAISGDRTLLETVRRDWRALQDGRGDPQPSLTGPDFVHADERFHRRLARASGNDVAETLLADLNDRIRILRIHDFTTEDRISSTIGEHLEILEAVLAEEPDAAAAFMRAHVERSALVVRERVGAALARMVETPCAAAG